MKYQALEMKFQKIQNLIFVIQGVGQVIRIRLAFKNVFYRWTDVQVRKSLIYIISKISDVR